jgi:tRNA (guanine26-N2/guanine27-N2)-dimethyltransferase
MLYQERDLQFHTGGTFYRAESQRSRDLGVLAAAVYRQQTGQLRVLDAMTGCGIRVLRYGVEAQADYLWANDGDPEVHFTLRQNLASFLERDRWQITHEPISRVLWQCALDRDYYDLIDIDAFGNPADFLPFCLSALRYGGLLYLTSTDGRSISGHFPQDSLRLYGSYARSHPSVQEQGLRILLGAIAQQAALQHYSIQPIFSLYHGQIYRVMVRLIHQVPDLVKTYGFLGHCPACGDYQSVNWRYLSRATCLHHISSQPLSLTGPLWLGSLHDRPFIAAMMEQAKQRNWPELEPLLTLFDAEAELPPYLFPLGEIGRRGKLDIPKRDRLIAALQAQGFNATETHLDPQAIKTNATLADCIAIAKVLVESI